MLNYYTVGGFQEVPLYAAHVECNSHNTEREPYLLPLGDIIVAVICKRWSLWKLIVIILNVNADM